METRTSRFSVERSECRLGLADADVIADVIRRRGRRALLVPKLTTSGSLWPNRDALFTTSVV